jgi:hypothetical protein
MTKRKPIDRNSPLGIGTALDRCVAADAECARQIDADAERRFKARDAKVAAIRERVPADMRGRFDALLEADREQRSVEEDLPKCEACSKALDVENEDYRVDSEGVYVCGPCAADPIEGAAQ